MEKRWVIIDTDEEKVKKLQQELKIHPILCRLLVQRGVASYDEAKDFFRPSLQHLHDPFLMKDMDKAVARIETAIAQNQKILIYGDYDVDGTTSVALMYSFLIQFYSNLPTGQSGLDYYIPNRYSEGYGISFQGVDYAAENNFKLIIALDCGIKSNDKVKYASEKGIDFIICDHHLPGENIPEATAVLDPKRKDCNYPYKELSGCGIGFKLIEAYAQKNDLPFEKVEQQLDLVAISIASDIVPITRENRVLAYFGLQLLQKNPRPGIKSLMEGAGMKGELTIDDLVFKVGPRINASGRMEDAKHAVKLMLSNESEAEEKAGILHTYNTDRRELDSNITEEALELIQQDVHFKNKKTTVLFQPHWNKGVIGIVASRLIENYYRPTIVLTESNGYATGSARSVEGYDLYEAIQSCADLLEQYGGHKYAAGLTLKLENIEKFKEKFEQVVSKTIDESLLTPEIKIDAELHFNGVTNEFFKILKQFAPFGPGNMKPIFVTKNVLDKGYTRIVKERHLKVSLHQNGSGTMNGIGFGMSKHIDIITSRLSDVCYHLEENEWNGEKKIEMRLIDAKPSK